MSVSRREFLYLSSVTGAALALPVPRRALAQAPAAAPPPKTAFETIRRNVGYFTGQGGTIGWMVSDGGVVIVDTQFPATAKICLDGVKERAKGRVPDLVFNTHHHGDHTGGNPVFKGVAKRIVAHANVPKLQKIGAQRAQPPTEGEQAYADVTFEKKWSESIGDEQLTAIHYGPAHTGGDAILRFERANVVHMGDLLFHQRHPFVDRPSGASIQNWMKTLETVAKEMPPDTLYIAGHSKEGLPVVLERNALTAFRDYFEAVLTHVRKAVAGGKSKEETSGLETLPGFDGYQGVPGRITLAHVLGIAFDELSAK